MTKRITAHYVTPDGSEVEYTPRPGFIPMGTLALDWDTLRSIVPGAGQVSFVPGSHDVVCVAENVYRSTDLLRVSATVTGDDGVTRADPSTETEVRRVVVQNFNVRD